MKLPKSKRIAAAALASTALAPLAPSAPAYAHPFDDDQTWADEHLLQQSGTVTAGNVVALWQDILYANGYLACGGVDGLFGPTTDNSTRNYQNGFGLTVDGAVGPNTWTHAKNRQEKIGTTDWTYWRIVPFSNEWTRNGFGTWQFRKIHESGGLTFYNTDHPARNFTKSC